MNKPDWKDAPEWANYLVRDTVDRTWWWYEKEPFYDGAFQRCGLDEKKDDSNRCAECVGQTGETILESREGTREVYIIWVEGYEGAKYTKIHTGYYAEKQYDYAYCLTENIVESKIYKTLKAAQVQAKDVAFYQKCKVEIISCVQTLKARSEYKYEIGRVSKCNLFQ